MNLREVEESYNIFEGVSFLILLLFFAKGSWWITSDLTNSMFFGTYDGFYMGRVFLFLPFLIIGFSKIKKATYDDRNNNDSIVGYCFVVSGFLFFISSALFITYYSISNSSSYLTTWELLNNISIAYLAFDFAGYISLFCSLLGLKRIGNDMNLRNSIFRLRFLLFGWFLVVLAEFLFDVLRFSYFIAISNLGFRNYYIINSVLAGSKYLIVAVFVLCLCFSKFIQGSSDVFSKTGKIMSVIFLSTTAMNFILENINNFVLDSVFNFSSFGDSILPMNNVIQLIEAVRTISLYLALIAIGIRMIYSIDGRDSEQKTETRSLNQDLFKGLLFVLLIFFLIENNYFMSKPKVGISGVFLTVYFNDVSGYPIDALFSIYGLSYLICTIMVVLLLIRKHSQQVSPDLDPEDKKPVNNLIIAAITVIALSMIVNFAFRMFFYSSTSGSDFLVFIWLAVVKGLEVLALMIIGILLMHNWFGGYIRDFVGKRNKLMVMVGTALIFQGLSGVGTILLNYYSLIAFPNILDIPYKLISGISSILYEISSIMLIVFVVLITLDSIQKNTFLHKVGKTFVVSILVILSVFKLMFVIAGFLPFSDYFNVLIDFQFQMSASVFDGLAAILFLYIIMFLSYGIGSRILERNNNVLNKSIRTKERITEFQN
ncbi:MAG: hypothetical protein ACTSQF_05680 [Candidatus Heimdallarchaeaceae archaeon]